MQLMTDVIFLTQKKTFTNLLTDICQKIKSTLSMLVLLIVVLVEVLVVVVVVVTLVRVE